MSDECGHQPWQLAFAARVGEIGEPLSNVREAPPTRDASPAEAALCARAGLARKTREGAQFRSIVGLYPSN